MEHAALTRQIIGCAMTVHRVLGPGFLESVYQNAFVHELGKHGLRVSCGKRIQVEYDSIAVGEFVADLIVEDRILIENKAIHALLPVHEMQVINYLSATGIEVGLLINFGAPRLEFRRKKRIRSGDKDPESRISGMEGILQDVGMTIWSEQIFARQFDLIP